MMNLRKIEKIAAKLEEELGLNDAGDELIDKALLDAAPPWASGRERKAPGRRISLRP